VVTARIGTAATTRMQFYRFKNQEYVLASRTLGAKDLRLIFVDILPNAIGTLITSSVLMIPGVIFSESSLSYLNIIDLSNSNITSVGTLLNEGSSFLASYPHMVLFPAIFISILMISFNLIGNGLRDAFNPTLRGEE
jgi:oligopeptide transport system permease protein